MYVQWDDVTKTTWLAKTDVVHNAQLDVCAVQLKGQSTPGILCLSHLGTPPFRLFCTHGSARPRILHQLDEKFVSGLHGYMNLSVWFYQSMNEDMMFLTTWWPSESCIGHGCQPSRNAFLENLIPQTLAYARRCYFRCTLWRSIHLKKVDPPYRHHGISGQRQFCSQNHHGVDFTKLLEVISSLATSRCGHWHGQAIGLFMYLQWCSTWKARLAHKYDFGT
jgi:hypothetical protein